MLGNAAAALMYRDTRPYLEFTISSGISAMDLFFATDDWVDDDETIDSLWGADNFLVYINGSLTDQSVTSITASSGDTIKIILEGGYSVFPIFYLYDETSLKSFPMSELLSPLPKLGYTPDEPATALTESYTGMYASIFHNSAVTTIPYDIFKNNTQLTTLSQFFLGCYSLTEIPEDIFSCMGHVTGFFLLLHKLFKPH